MADNQTPKDDYYTPHSESFAVVMLKNGVAPHTAKPDDFLRVSVVARDAFSARSDAQVTAAEATHQVVQVMNPGGFCQAESDARRRAYDDEHPAFDRTQVRDQFTPPTG